MSERLLLEGEAAKKKWKKGRDVWNQWVNENPEADVSFASVDFDDIDCVADPRLNREFNFSRYRFPKGNVKFSGAKFGEGNINFSGANFGEGNVDFSGANFGKGNVNFSGANFGEGNVNFSSANFDEGVVNFSGANFGEGNVDFSRANFGEGVVDFASANFGEGVVHFIGANFGAKYVIFTNVNFGVGYVIFYGTNFGKGDVDFSGANFGEGVVDFNRTKFEGETVNFALLKITGDAQFTNILVSQNCEIFSFHKATFDGPFSLSYELVNGTPEDSPRQYAEMNFITDLIGTKTSHHVNLHNLYCKPKFAKNFFFNTAKDIDDAARLGRLKELAESNKDHESALRFHADEMRVKRWIKTPMMASILDFMFDKMSNYGQSILKPSCWLICMFLLILVVSFYGTPFDSKMFNHLGNAINLSLSKTIPFVSGLVIEGKDAAKELGLSGGRKALINLLSVFSYICLFLIGLGLRNRFRI
ncbi:hypothetical protein AKG98_3175 [Moritella sp. JT01]|uniref:pentapeptide repeat-containing protein n=1 Tax=Moritella sp. JT01 TaxID=756698 RepID=UPI00079B1EF4|nr:pentapeptide repeat-containing protein [Moritella sp. JT01]KXO06515.1 hypothetical protein AKG98_3175 [Moritella sp. JT01]